MATDAAPVSARIDEVRLRAEDEAAAIAREAVDLIVQALPGVRVEPEGRALRISGRDVARRWREAGIGDLLRRQWR